MRIIFYLFCLQVSNVVTLANKTNLANLTCYQPLSVTNVLVNSTDTSKQYIVFGVQNHFKQGIGNYLKYYADVYFFAVFTGRDIVIEPRSLLGDFCNHIQCGFPLLTDEIRSFNSSRRVSCFDDFKKHMNAASEKDRLDEKLIYTSDISDNTFWWDSYASQGALNCITKLSNCPADAIYCHVAYAMQQLVLGPLLSPMHLHRIVGVTDGMKKSLLHKRKQVEPYWRNHPRPAIFDVGIQLRNQFIEFEAKNSRGFTNETEYAVEVTNWLQSEICTYVFAGMENRVLEIADNAKLKKQSDSARLSVYITGDNAETKIALDNFLKKSAALLNANVTLSISRLENRETIRHGVWMMSTDAAASNHTGLADMTIDWYALAMSENVLTWRKGNLDSTFAASARRLYDRVGHFMMVDVMNKPFFWQDFD